MLHRCSRGGVLIVAVVATLLLVACGGRTRRPIDPQTIYVSIAPLKGLAERIVGDDFPIEVLVPAGASPETFEPTPRQLIAVNECRWLFAVGLIDFETALLQKIERQDKVVALHTGIELIAGSCSHGHTTETHNHEAEHAHSEHAHEHKHGGHAHAHGIDPHIWTSPRALQQIAANLYATIQAAYPDSVRYAENYAALQSELQRLDHEVAATLAASEVRSFVIYHPALTYYARDYGLRQTAIEQEGKEPSPRHLAELIDAARREGVRTILYQRQFPRSSVEAVAEDMAAEPVEFDPLAEDICAVIRQVTQKIAAR